MKIVNLSARVIGVDGHSILPGEEYEVTREIAESASIRMQAAMGMLKITDGENKKAGKLAKAAVKPADAEKETAKPAAVKPAAKAWKEE